MSEVYTCPNCGEEMDQGKACGVCDHTEEELCDCESCEEPAEFWEDEEDDDDEAN